MSRSYKKNPVYKHCDKDMKRLSNKRFRKRSIDETNTRPYHYLCSYDISDWEYRAPDQPEAWRK